MGAVGVGFSQEEPCGVVVLPSGRVAVGTLARVGRDVARICSESGEAGHPVGVVVGKERGLDGRAPFGGLSAPDVVFGMNRIPEGVGHRGQVVTAGAVSGGRRIARRVGDGNGAPGDVGLRRGGVSSSVGLGQSDPCGREGARLRGRDARVVRLRGGEAVDDRRRDVGGRNTVFLRPLGPRAVFRPRRGCIAARVGGDGFLFDGRAFGKECRYAFRVGRALAVVFCRGGNPVDAVGPCFHAVGVGGDPGVRKCGAISQFPGFFHHVAEGVVGVQSRSHDEGGGGRSVIALAPGEQAPGAVRLAVVDERVGLCRGLGRADALAEDVGDLAADDDVGFSLL